MASEKLPQKEKKQNITLGQESNTYHGVRKKLYLSFRQLLILLFQEGENFAPSLQIITKSFLSAALPDGNCCPALLNTYSVSWHSTYCTHTFKHHTQFHLKIQCLCSVKVKGPLFLTLQN